MRDQLEGAIVERRVHVLPFPSRLTMAQGDEDAECCVGTRDEVYGRGSDPNRRS